MYRPSFIRTATKGILILGGQKGVEYLYVDI